MNQSFWRICERSARIMLAAALALIVALPARPIYVFAAQDGNLRLDITPVANAIQAGEIARFRVEFENVSGGALPNVALSLPISGPVEGVRLIPQGANGIRTDSAEVGETGVSWQGGLGPNGRFAFLLAVKSPPTIESAEEEIVINGRAAPEGEAEIVQDATVTVTAPAPVDDSAVTLQKTILYRNANGEPDSGSRVNIAPRQEVGIQLELTNNSDQVVYSLLVDEMTPEPEALSAAGAGNDEACSIRYRKPRVIDGRGMPVTALALAEAGITSETTATYGFLVAAQPGESATVRIRARATGTAGCELGGEAIAYLSNLPPAAGGQFDAQNAIALLPQFSGLPSVQSLLALLIITVNDFGDAPDSTNNAGNAFMDAYPSFNIQANFPTSFQPGVAPQGPVHINPFPLRLGTQVSWEPSADNGVRRNIDPPTPVSVGTPNLDLHDDGVDVSTLNFPSCLGTTIDYEFTANQTAVNLLAGTGGVAYVNVWLDGNRNGIWEDTYDCDGITAYEHIVVDQPVAVNAPGTYSLVLPTGNIPIDPADLDQPMWLRITISERESIKTLPGNVGDGRGPNLGFLIGETEDYLYVPPAAAPLPSALGPDARLDLESTVEVDDTAPPTLAAAEASALRGRYLNTIIRLRNTGDLPTGNVKLVLESDPYLGQPQSSDAKCCRCLTCTVASALVTPLSVEEENTPVDAPFREVCEGGVCRLEADLGYMEPGDSGRVWARWALPESVSDDVTLKASLITDGDVRPDNDSRQFISRLPIRTPTITAPGNTTLGWTGCLTCTVAAGGPDSAPFQVKGFAEPGSTLRIFTDGFESGDVRATADDKGFWQAPMALPDGSYEITAEYADIGGVTAEEIAALEKSEPILLIVDSTLPWNPASLGYIKFEGVEGESVSAAEADDSCGPWQFRNDLGRTDPTDWQIPVFKGTTHEVGVELVCENPTGAELRWPGGSLPLTDGDGDGLYTGLFAAPEIDDEPAVRLVVTCGGVESAYAGRLVPAEPAKVVDATTGAALDQAQITLWQGSSNVDSSDFHIWEAQAYGQDNPQTSDAQGQFTFLLPPGSYGLTAQIDGYQPFRAGPLSLQGVFPSRSLALTPVTPTGSGAAISFSADGFDPPALEIPVGATVEWINTGLDSGSTASSGAAVTAAAASAVAWDSGRLNPGDSYRLRFDEAGVYTYVNGEDPSQQATVIVSDEPAPAEMQIFMPIVVGE